jgi:sugar lactone lactonase YvrE
VHDDDDEPEAAVEPELIADYQCVVGEGPLWHPDEQRVYWTDIVTGRLFRCDPASGQHEQVYAGGQVGLGHQGGRTPRALLRVA